jgi:hypothetical protein
MNKNFKSLKPELVSASAPPVALRPVVSCGAARIEQRAGDTFARDMDAVFAGCAAVLDRSAALLRRAESMVQK